MGATPLGTRVEGETLVARYTDDGYAALLWLGDDGEQTIEVSRRRGGAWEDAASGASDWSPPDPPPDRWWSGLTVGVVGGATFTSGLAPAGDAGLERVERLGAAYVVRLT